MYLFIYLCEIYRVWDTQKLAEPPKIFMLAIWLCQIVWAWGTELNIYCKMLFQHKSVQLDSVKVE